METKGVAKYYVEDWKDTEIQNIRKRHLDLLKEKPNKMMMLSSQHIADSTSLLPGETSQIIGFYHTMKRQQEIKRKQGISENLDATELTDCSNIMVATAKSIVYTFSVGFKDENLVIEATGIISLKLSSSQEVNNKLQVYEYLPNELILLNWNKANIFKFTVGPEFKKQEIKL